MLGKSPFQVVSDRTGSLMHETFERAPSASEFVEICQRDLSIIRQDLMSVLEETADVRATLSRFSSGKPTLSKPFFLTCSLLGLLIVIVMIIYQPQLSAWLQAARGTL